MKLVRKYLNSGTLNKVLELQKDPIPESALPLRKNKKIATDYASAYGSVPLIDSSLPADHPSNIHSAIAQREGWIEVPARYIDMTVNKRWEKQILKAVEKYGADTKYIVNPKTREIIPESVFNKYATDLGFKNGSEQIDLNRTAFEVQLAKNHRDLLKRNPQILGATLMAGGLSLPPAWPLLYALGSIETADLGISDFERRWSKGNYLGAAAGGVADAAITLAPFGKASLVAKYAPRVAGPLLATLAATNAYAQDASRVEPHNFTTTLTPDQKAMVEDENTPWEEIGNNELARKEWETILEKELGAAHFTRRFMQDEFQQPAVKVFGNKGAGAPLTTNESPLYKDPWAYVRYIGPFAIEGGARLLKLFKNIKWAPLLKGLGWAGYYYGNLAYDNNWWPFLNTGTEENPDGYDEGLAAYYQKLVNAYLRLQSPVKNAYAVGSTFSPWQTHPTDANGNSANNYDPRTKTLFEKPDTNAIILIQAIPVQQNKEEEKSTDSLTNEVSLIKPAI